MLEQRERQDARLDALKHSILRFPGPVPRDRIQSLFPEFFPADLVFEDAKKDDGTYDIDKVAVPALRHRLVMSFAAEAAGVAPAHIVERVLVAARRLKS